MPRAPAGHKQVDGGVVRLDHTKAQALARQKQLLPALEALRPMRETLLAARQKRPQPARDEKIVTGGNALAIIGFAEAGDDLHEPALTRVALAAANWEWTHAFNAGTAFWCTSSIMARRASTPSSMITRCSARLASRCTDILVTPSGWRGQGSSPMPC